MIKEDFAIGHSFLHKRDVCVKIIVAACFAMQVALCHDLSIAMASLVLGLFFLWLSDLCIKSVCRRLLIVNMFTLFLCCILPLSYGGEEYITPFGIPLSIAGVQLAGLIAIKTNASLLVFMSLLSTSSPAALGWGLERLRVPRKLCYILLFSYRYIFVIHNEYLTLYRAAKMRCFQPSTNMHTYKTYAYLFGMTLVRSYNRAERINQAMVLRGFTGKLHSLYIPQSSLGDKVFGCLSLAVIGILFFLQ